VRLALRVNDEARTVETLPGERLADVLRERLGLFGTRVGCGVGRCGTCVVLLDGEPVRSCATAVEDAAGHNVTTVEGLARGATLHPLQEAFLAEDALQCGFCTSGLLVAGAALLAHTPRPSDDQIRAALEGHLCRCGVYGRVVRAVRRAAGEDPG
jgi:aerobic-type carbon monoxide dehydrogenase small subunit (CoxS/CutS family)